jgi:phosphoribosylformimino-5-aminoimidazole carboxamide ribotide isomerase
LAQCFGDEPVAAIIYTDIARDGMMQGANIDAMREMKQATDIPVIASGGVTTLEDVRELAAAGLDGAIIGRSLYEGEIQLHDAILLAKEAAC